MKVRQANFEILRIVSMLAVVVSHYLVWGTNQYGGSSQGGFINGGVNSSLYPFLSSFSSIGVLCFVMITSYFISGSRVVRLDRIMKVWMPTLFYSVVMALVSSLIEETSPKEILKSLAPVGTGQYWFVTKYIALIMLAPILSIIVDSVSRRGLIIILSIMAFLTLTITCGIPYGNQFFEDNPFSVAVFVLIFFIASYIRKYELCPWIVKYCGWIFLTGIMFQSIWGLGMNILRKPEDFIYGGFSISYNAFSLLPATALFIWFKNHSFKDGFLTRLACRLAPYVFAAYLIHDNPHFRMILWGKLFVPADYWQSPMWTVFALIVPTAIVLISCIIDMGRGKLFSLCGVDKLVRKVGCHNFSIE